MPCEKACDPESDKAFEIKENLMLFFLFPLKSNRERRREPVVHVLM